MQKKIRPINRLDFNTSGIVIFAKCEYIQESLSKQMQQNIFYKEYLGFIDGFLENKKGSISLPIGRKSDSIIERCVCTDGQPSVTHYEVLNEFDNFSFVKFVLETGRTHQIRVHMSHLCHPLLGDTLYGKKSSLFERQALHSYKVKFIHPVLKKDMCFICDIPSDFKSILNK